MKESGVVLKAVTEIVVLVLLTFGFYIYLVNHNNPGGGSISGLVFNSTLILMFLALDIKKVLDSLPIDFRKLMTIGVLISLIAAAASTFLDKSFLYQSEFILHLLIFSEMHTTIMTIFELGIILSVVGVVIIIVLTLSEGKS